jgi:alpha-tubulin suppressor-like RCC1 family protein
LYSWGIGTSGQLGHKNFAKETDILGDKYLQEEPRKMLKSKNFNKIAIGDSYSLALTYDGDLYGMGTGLINFNGDHKGEHKEPIPLVTGKKIKHISAGMKHAGFVNASGEAFTWGYNGGWFQGGGQLGHGSSNEENQPK